MKNNRLSSLLLAGALAGAAAPLLEGSARDAGRVTTNAQAQRKKEAGVFGLRASYSSTVASSPNGGRGGKHANNRQHIRAATKSRSVRRHRASAR
jgi:hypothetical protein